MSYPTPVFGKHAKTLLLILLANVTCQAKIINVTTNDSYAKIEAAVAGDEVAIAGGTYAFRLYLTHQASPTNPIVIRALDPAHPPIWDFGSTLVENAPGSYTAGDRGRGGWQFSGAHNYTISGIVIRRCRTASFNSAGIRYYNGTTNLYLKDCVFQQNDDGLTGGTQNSQATVEFCEFDSNGNLNASSSSPTHNIYVYGGYLALRYCYVHDSVQGANFHIRCRQSTLEYNWFARANNYEGDLMTDDDFSGTGPFMQTMTLRGNVFVQNQLPGNHSQVVAVYNDGGLANLTLSVRMLYNTFVGVNTNSALVHVSNADGTAMIAEISNNIIYGTRTPVLIEDAEAATVSGFNNFLQTNATAGPLTGSVRSASPGFRDPASSDFRLSANSAAIGAASAQVFGLPGKEYFQNELANRQWRIRNAARDLGAFESTSTSAPVSPYSSAPAPKLNAGLNGTNTLLSWPLYAQDFQLYRSGGTFPLAWTPAPDSRITNLAGISVVAAQNQKATWFRLKQ
jgi:hypothetical protein